MLDLHKLKNYKFEAIAITIREQYFQDMLQLYMKTYTVEFERSNLEHLYCL